MVHVPVRKQTAFLIDLAGKWACELKSIPQVKFQWDGGKADSANIKSIDF